MNPTLAEHFSKLQDFTEQVERITTRTLKDGRRIYLRPQLYNVRLVVERDIYTEDGWCFLNLRAALTALYGDARRPAWDPETEEEPAGWIKHPATGRRRVSIFCGQCGEVIGQLEWRRW